METNHHIWRIWSDGLHRWGLTELVASFLEAAGPLTLIGAQFIYLGQPIIRGLVNDQHLFALAHMLEESDQRQAFVAYLLEEARL